MKVVSVASHYSEQPEELLITISRIKDAACPYRYFKGYVERPKTKESFESIEAGLAEVWCPGFAGNQWLAVLTLQFTRGIREVSERGLAAYGVGASLVAAQITEY